MARPVQPKCGDCNHSKSFHKNGIGLCRAYGCDCGRWRKPKEKDAS